MSIHFNQTNIKKVLETIKDAHDLADVYNDVCRIEQALNSLQMTLLPLSLEEYNNMRQYAKRLDEELREKYPSINAMLDEANLFPRRPIAIPIRSQVKEEVVSNLEQDYYGILCDTALKKAIISSIKEFITLIDSTAVRSGGIQKGKNVGKELI